MKRIIKILAATTACLMCLTTFPLAFAQDADITVDGTWSVLAPASPSAYENYAANKIADVLSELFGTAVPVVTSASGKYIAVGSASSADVSGVAVNGYRITAEGGNIHINGTGTRGVQAGAHRFLEEFCGRKVYTYNIIVLPEASAISVPADTDIVYEPFFEYTDTDWRSPRNREYSMANGLNGGPYRSLPGELGGTVDYIEGFCHTMGSLCETESYKDTHPEYLALHDGKRTTAQPCLTNPDVLEIAKKNVLDKLARRSDPNAPVQIVSVTQNDNYDYCECENCRAFEAAHGGVQSATMINFVNQIADAVKEAGYENAAIDTFAYQYTRKAPTGIVPRDNVIVRLCTIECCFCHALDDPDCDANVELMRDLSDWSEICNRIYVWDYVNNYSNTCLVFPDFGVIQRNIQIFYENNVRGVYEEGNYYIDSCDTEFGELRAYMISKALQDPYCDMDAEVNGFLEAYYGPGWQSMRAILDMFTEEAGCEGTVRMGIGAGVGETFDFTNREVAKIDAYWKAAKDAAETETQLANLERSEISWRFWKGSVNKGEFSILNPERYNEKRRLYADVQAAGVTMINEWSPGDYLDCICPEYVPVAEWNSYEADELPARIRLRFFTILEKFTPILSAFGLYYRFSQLLNGAAKGPDC